MGTSYSGRREAKGLTGSLLHSFQVGSTWSYAGAGLALIADHPRGLGGGRTRGRQRKMLEDLGVGLLPPGLAPRRAFRGRRLRLRSARAAVDDLGAALLRQWNVQRPSRMSLQVRSLLMWKAPTSQAARSRSAAGLRIFFKTSCSMCLSSVTSASTLLSLRFCRRAAAPASTRRRHPGKSAGVHVNPKRKTRCRVLSRGSRIQRMRPLSKLQGFPEGFGQIFPSPASPSRWRARQQPWKNRPQRIASRRSRRFVPLRLLVFATTEAPRLLPP